jgi:pyrroline-5-carboxylate reductase
LKMIACIGAGNMGTALMKGVPAEVQTGFTDADGAKAQEAAAKTGALVFASNTEAALRGDFVFLAVKPQVLDGVLVEIAPVIRERAASGNPPVLVSMAAGWTLSKIEAALSAPEAGTAAIDASPPVPIARIMPNTPALISRGMIAYCTTPGFPAAQLDELKTILAGAGQIDPVDEALLDAVTGLSGSGPAFVYEFIEAMSDGGVLAGLPRDKALRYAAQTVLGAAAMVLETGKHPGELKDMVTSPGGTTIRGLAVLEQNAFRGAIIQAVEAAWRRAKELG